MTAKQRVAWIGPSPCLFLCRRKVFGGTQIQFKSVEWSEMILKNNNSWCCIHCRTVTRKTTRRWGRYHCPVLEIRALRSHGGWLLRDEPALKPRCSSPSPVLSPALSSERPWSWLPVFLLWRPHSFLSDVSASSVSRGRCCRLSSSVHMFSRGHLSCR